MKTLYYVKFDALLRKPSPNQTPSLIWALPAESEADVLKIAESIGTGATIVQKNALSKDWQ